MSTPVHEPSCRRDLDGVVATAHRLVLRYGDHTAMDTSTFVIPTHAVTAVIGPNGSGKSTVLNALAGLVEPASGTLQVLGSDPADVRRRVSYVLQSVTVAAGTPITVAETVGMGRYPNLGLWRRRSDTDRHRVRTAMERLAITGLEHKHLTELSGGQRQRVYVAQGIAQGHEVLLLDEPLTGLDQDTASKIVEIISNLELSYMIISHDIDFLWHTTTQICTIKQGKIIFEDKSQIHVHRHLHPHGEYPHQHDH